MTRKAPKELSEENILQGYAKFLESLKNRMREAQVKATLVSSF